MRCLSISPCAVRGSTSRSHALPSARCAVADWAALDRFLHRLPNCSYEIIYEARDFDLPQGVRDGLTQVCAQTGRCFVLCGPQLHHVQHLDGCGRARVGSGGRRFRQACGWAGTTVCTHPLSLCPAVSGPMLRAPTWLHPPLHLPAHPAPPASLFLTGPREPGAGQVPHQGG